MKRNGIMILAGLALLTATLKAQTFSYSFIQGSSNYQELSGAEVIENGASWNRNGYALDFGFDFAFQGKNFPGLTVTSNGWLLFGDDNTRAIAAFKGVRPVADGAGGYSSISWQVSGTTGDRILKIQYKNCGFGFRSPDIFNFQVWLYEGNGKIEFHTGYTTLSAVQDSLVMPIVGVLDPSRSGSSNGFLISGDPAQATSVLLGEGELKYLDKVPAANTVYTLTPQ